MIEGSCHCGKVAFEITQEPQWLVDCNCSICSRLGALWGHLENDQFELTKGEGKTIAYIQGDKMLAMHTCKHCGCTTHWLGLDDSESRRMAVNFRMCAAEDRSRFRIRQLDGADTWEYLD